MTARPVVPADDLGPLAEPEFALARNPRASVTTPDFCPERGEPPRRDTIDQTWEQLMPDPEGEWEATRRHQNDVLQILPRRLRRIVLRMRNTHWRGVILDLIVDELTGRAVDEDRLHHTNAATEVLEVIHAPLTYIPGADVRRLLGAMANDSPFTARLLRSVRATRRLARTLNTWSFNPDPLAVPRTRLPRSGLLQAEAWCGLTLSPLPHRAPEGVLCGIARLFWQRGRRRPNRPQRLLDWGAGNSPFTKALLLTAPSEVRCENQLLVDEVDVLGDSPSDLAFVRRSCSVTAGPVYDFALVQLPPPCVGRGGYRDRYKGLPAGKLGQTRLRDLGRLGVKRWQRSVSRVIRPLLTLTAPREAALLIPLFEVDASEGSSAHGLFERACAELRQVLGDAGLTITHDFTVTSTEVEVAWRCIAATRRLRGAGVRTASDDVTLAANRRIQP